MDLTNQKRMAGEVMKCGVHRVYFNPNNIEEISEAVTRQDIRKLVQEGIIKAKQKNGISSGRKKKMMAHTGPVGSSPRRPTGSITGMPPVGFSGPQLI
jgi:ribosomal protein L19E